MNGITEATALYLAKCIANFDNRKGPRVGDFIYLQDGTLRRFTHDWDDGLQVTSNGNDESFHLGKSGYISFSGSLDPQISKEKIKPIYKTMPGRVWVWLDGIPGAGRATYANINCRVYQEV